MIAELQKAMASSLSNPANGMTNIPGLSHYSQAEAQARLSVYRNNVFYSLIDVLKDAFPTVLKLVGEDFFSAATKEFITVRPPCSPILSQYGEHFPNFLGEIPVLKDHPYIPDLALLDWQHHNVWYCEEQNSLCAEDFARLDIGQLSEAKLSLQNSLRIIESHYAIFSIWQENQNNEPQTINFETAESVLIVRPGNEVDVYKLDSGNLTFIKKLHDNFSLNESIQLAFEADSEFNPTHAIDFLITNGLCTAIRLDTNN